MQIIILGIAHLWRRTPGLCKADPDVTSVSVSPVPASISGSALPGYSTGPEVSVSGYAGTRIQNWNHIH